MAASVTSSSAAGGVGDVVEAARIDAEHDAGQRAAGRRLARLQDLEGRRARRPRPERPCRRARRPARARRRTAARASGHYNSRSGGPLLARADVHRACPRCMNIATRLRIDSVRADERGRQRSSEHLLLGRRDRRRALLRRDALRPARPAEPRQRSLRAVEGARRADPVRRLGRGRLPQARGPADAAPPRFRSRRASDAAAAVGRRRHRIARPGALRRRRHRAQRAAHRVRLPHLRAARRRRDRPKARSGRPPTSPAFDKLDSLCGITDVNALGQSGPTQWQHDMEALAARWRAFGWHALVVDGHDLPAILDALEKARADQGPADDDPGEDAQGQGHLVRWRGRAAGTARR